MTFPSYKNKPSGCWIPVSTALTGLCKCGVVASCLLIFILCFQPGILCAAPNGSPPRLKQEQIKAVYLYNFLNFVTWPDYSKKTSTNTTSRIIGILGKAPISRALHDLATSLAETRRMKIKMIDYGPYKDGMELKNCDILFINNTEQNNFKKIIANLGQAPVLTVSDNKNFVKKGGMISLFEVNDRIRYSINRQALNQAGLKSNSLLLNSAVK